VPGAAGSPPQAPSAHPKQRADGWAETNPSRPTSMIPASPKEASAQSRPHVWINYSQPIPNLH